MKKTKESQSDAVKRIANQRGLDRISAARDTARKLNEWRAQQVADRANARIRVFVQKPHMFDDPVKYVSDKFDERFDIKAEACKEDVMSFTNKRKVTIKGFEIKPEAKNENAAED
jgi:hypothetical protein